MTASGKNALTNSLPCITGDVNHPQCRTRSQHSICKIAAVHSGHYNVGQQEVNSSLLASAEFACLSAVAGLKDCISKSLQDVSGQSAEGRFILNQENGLVTIQCVDGIYTRSFESGTLLHN